MGHIEDVAVIHSAQGRGVGRNLVRTLDKIGENAGAYKNILSCSSSKELYYTRLGFEKKSATMVCELLILISMGKIY